MSYAGLALDIYDDPRGLVLHRCLVENGLELPEKLASAALLSADQLDQLPDRLFALVDEDGGFRKYAMHDEPHLTTSILYFMDKQSSFDRGTAATIATNLVNACAWYDVDPPEPLVKVALGAGTLAVGALGAMGGVAEMKEKKKQNREEFDSFRRAQMEGMKTSAGVTVPYSAGGTVAPVSKRMDDDRAARGQVKRQNVASQDECNDGITPFGKQADLQGTELMPVSGGNKPLPADHKHKTVSAKVAAMLPRQHQSTKVAFATPQEAEANYNHFAFPHTKQYPIDNAELVKQADAYFAEYRNMLQPEERRIFASNLEKRAAELGVKIGSAVLEYAGDDYGPFVQAELLARQRVCAGTGHEAVYEVLQEKLAEVSPAVLASMLAEADHSVGLDASYGRTGVGVRDPYAAVFGKFASEEAWSWSEGNEYTTTDRLERLAKSGTKLNETFGEGFEVEFRKDPVGVFKSLPHPQKVLLSRLAGDN